MTGRFGWTIVLALFLAFSLLAAQPGGSGAQASADDGYPPHFSVEMHATKDGKTYVMQRAVDGEKTRMDMNADGHQISTIMLDDEKGTMYTLLAEQKRVIKQTRTAAEKLAHKAGEEMADEDVAAAPEAQGQLELLGQETIDGKQADKYRATYAEGSGLIWVDAATNLPLRIEAEGATVDFKNYDFGPQPAALFQPPADWEVVDMDEMMANMPEGMGFKGMMGAMAGSMGGGIGGSLGGALGGTAGGPLGSMAGQFLGQKIGATIGGAAAGAATGP